MKKVWISLCSMHARKDENCKMCNAGEWRYEWRLKFCQWLQHNFYSIWFFINNRSLPTDDQKNRYGKRSKSLVNRESP